jgi:hypothetical protein
MEHRGALMKVFARAGTATGIASAAVLVAVACSSGGPASARPAMTLMPSVATAPPAPAVAAIPGSSKNEYQAGPFKVLMKDLVTLPAKLDEEDKHPKCAQVDVVNATSYFTGWVAPTVEFVAGHSRHGNVLDTEAADPTGGGSSGASGALSPGQHQVLYACPHGIPDRTYATFHLTQAAYGTVHEGTMDGTTVRLK